MKRLCIIFIFISTFIKSQQINWIDTVIFGDVNVANKICMDSVSNIYLAGLYSVGHYYNGTFLQKYSANGAVLWTDTTQNSNMAQNGGVTLHGHELYTIDRIGATSDFQGVTYGPGMYLIKRDLSGHVQWVVQQNFDSPFDVTTDQLGNIYVAAGVYGNMSVKKYNNSGVLLNTINNATGYMATDNWNNLYVIPGNLNKYDQNGPMWWTVAVGPNSKLTVDKLGNCYVFQGGYNMTSSLTKFTPSGVVAWNTSLPFDGAYGICCDSNSCVFVAGLYGTNQVSSGVEIRKFDGSGNNLWTYQLPNSINMIPVSLIAQNGTLFMAANHGFYYEGYFLKISEPHVITALSANEVTKKLDVSPNPSHSVFNIKYKDVTGKVFLRITDLTGKRIVDQIYSDIGKDFTQEVNLDNYSPGVYLLEVQDDQTKLIYKLIVE